MNLNRPDAMFKTDLYDVYTNEKGERLVRTEPKSPMFPYDKANEEMKNNIKKGPETVPEPKTK